MLVDATGLRLELLARSTGGPGLRAGSPVEAASTWGFGHLCFEVGDLDGVYGRLLHRGATSVLDPRPAPQEGWRMAWVHDPEGNLIELICGSTAHL